MTTDTKIERAKAVAKKLVRAVPEVHVELDFDSPWQLLVATILSAQSTDKLVNRVTPELFRRYPTPEALAVATQAEIEVAVKSTGYFRNKARAIREASRTIVEHHKGEVPRTMDGMLGLAGVARKTANVVLGMAYGISAGIAVDTHVGRVARRLSFSEHDSPVKVEEDLMQLFPKKEWIAVGARLVLHGRYVCTARAPACSLCPVNEECPTRESPPVGRWTARADTVRQVIESRGETRLAVVPSPPEGDGRRPNSGAKARARRVR